MHLRVSLVAAVLGAAAVAAGLRALHAGAPAASPFAVATPVHPFAGLGPATTGSSPFATGAPPVGPSARPRRPPRIVVYVAGAVARAGLYRLPSSARAADALAAAGGATAGADLVAVDLAAPLADGDEVAVPLLGASRSHRRTSSHVADGVAGPLRRPSRHYHHKRRRDVSGSAADASGAGESGAEPADVVDLNSADASELETLPGIGPALANRIVAFREQAGPFASVDDLLDVGGMTQSRLDAVTPFVTVR
jgi:competence protein ComEA